MGTPRERETRRQGDQTKRFSPGLLACPSPPLPISLSPRLLSTSSLLIPLCLFLFFHRLGDRDLWSSHEARAAMNAQTILDDGDWLLPHLYDGQPELQKPPL